MVDRALIFIILIQTIALGNNALGALSVKVTVLGSVAFTDSIVAILLASWVAVVGLR